MHEVGSFIAPRSQPRTSLGKNHVQRGGPATARLLVVVVDEVLVVREGVHCLQVAALEDRTGQLQSATLTPPS